MKLMCICSMNCSIRILQLNSVHFQSFLSVCMGASVCCEQLIWTLIWGRGLRNDSYFVPRYWGVYKVMCTLSARNLVIVITVFVCIFGIMVLNFLQECPGSSYLLLHWLAWLSPLLVLCPSLFNAPGTKSQIEAELCLWVQISRKMNWSPTVCFELANCTPK